jgi:hypothetical protein
MTRAYLMYLRYLMFLHFLPNLHFRLLQTNPNYLMFP